MICPLYPHCRRIQCQLVQALQSQAFNFILVFSANRLMSEHRTTIIEFGMWLIRKCSNAINAPTIKCDQQQSDPQCCCQYIHVAVWSRSLYVNIYNVSLTTFGRHECSFTEYTHLMLFCCCGWFNVNIFYVKCSVDETDSRK